MKIAVRNTQQGDFQGIIALTRQVYPFSLPWNETQLNSHLAVFAEGQFVAIDETSSRILGYAASLIVSWDDYETDMNWKDFTDKGMFTNHDPAHGRTLYGAEIMVHPDAQGQGIGKQLYATRENLVRRLGLLRIRAGARLRDYHLCADHLTPAEYVADVIRGRIIDRTLSFQLRRGFHAIDVVSNYLPGDPESLGYAAIIEWINPDVAKKKDYQPYRRSRFYGLT